MKAVIAPIQATEVSHIGTVLNIKWVLAMRYMPPFTMVAPCSRQLTAVGASMALYNHVCRGSCADFATAPIRVKKEAEPRNDNASFPISSTWPNDSKKEKVPKFA